MTTKLARTLCIGALSGMALVLGTAIASAEELPRTHIKTIGTGSYMYQYKLEVPFFGKTISERSNGRVTVDLLPYNQVGLSGFEILRLLKVGALEFARGDISYLGSDDSKFEAPDLAGVATTVKQAIDAYEAYMPILSKIMEEKWNSKLLMMALSPPVVFWCNTPGGFEGLKSLNRLKVRVFNKSLTDFVKGAGATAITMPSGEVVAAMQRKVMDCAVTGSMNGNSAGWPEVTTHLFPMYVGWSTQYWAVNLKTWNRLDPRVQDFLQEQFDDLSVEINKIAKLGETEGINCSAGIGPCTEATKFNMTLVKITEKDRKARKEIIENYVLRGWAERCGKECAEEWNEVVGKPILNLTAPTDQ